MFCRFPNSDVSSFVLLLFVLLRLEVATAVHVDVELLVWTSPCEIRLRPPPCLRAHYM